MSMIEKDKIIKAEEFSNFSSNLKLDDNTVQAKSTGENRSSNDQVK